MAKKKAKKTKSASVASLKRELASAKRHVRVIHNAAVKLGKIGGLAAAVKRKKTVKKKKR